MSYTLTIDGNVYAPIAQSIIIKRLVNGEDTLEFAIILQDSTQPIEIGDGGTFVVDGVTIFGGTVDEAHEEDILLSDGRTVRKIRYIMEDYNQICDRRIVANVYTNDTMGNIIADIVTNYLTDEGITVDNVETGPTIDKAVFNYATVASAFNEISDLTGFYWWIDSDKDLHFSSRATNAAPWSITAGNNPYMSFRVRRNRIKYRNRQYVRAGQDTTDPRTEDFVGDGTRQTFTLQYPVAAAPTITLDEDAQTVGILGIDTGQQWYWNKGSYNIVQELTDGAIEENEDLAVTYTGLFPIIVQAESDTEIAARAAAENLSGIYEHVTDDPNIDDSDDALTKAQGLLRRFGSIDKIVMYKTRTAGIEPGQLQRIEVAEHDINGDYLIDRVIITLEDNGEDLRYDITALSGEAFGGWAEFFQRLALHGRRYAIRENEVLVLLRTIEDAFSLSDTVDAVQDTHLVGTAIVGFTMVAA